jgi:hypothetical protein
MEKMQISVVGRETGKDSDVEISEGEDSPSDHEEIDDPNLN